MTLKTYNKIVFILMVFVVIMVLLSHQTYSLQFLVLGLGAWIVTAAILHTQIDKEGKAKMWRLSKYSILYTGIGFAIVVALMAILAYLLLFHNIHPPKIK